MNERLDLKTNNFNMSTGDSEGFMTEAEYSLCPWPRKIKVNDKYINQWFHSDYKDVSYQHVNKFYKKITMLIR
ncbi:MAG: hypothetical protein N2645_10105 [Clostridia bacterium]|nr:hypothetical protein [Clostridia bacterium]